MIQYVLAAFQWGPALSLTPIAIALIMVPVAFFCGVANRVRGGLWKQGGDGPGRALWGLAIAIVGAVCDLHAGAVIAILIGGWLGCSTPLFSSLGIVTKGADGHYHILPRCFAGLAAFTAGRLILPGLVIAVLGLPWFCLLPMLLLGPALYALSWWWPFEILWMQIVPGPTGDGVHPFEGPTFGEFAWGVAAAVCFALACAA
jgi:hypothetical protein